MTRLSFWQYYVVEMTTRHTQDSDVPGLRSALTDAGMSLTQLSGKLGLSISRLSRYQSGGRKTPISVAVAMSEAIGCSLERLTTPTAEVADV